MNSEHRPHFILDSRNRNEGEPRSQRGRRKAGYSSDFRTFYFNEPLILTISAIESSFLFANQDVDSAGIAGFSHFVDRPPRH